MTGRAQDIGDRHDRPIEQAFDLCRFVRPIGRKIGYRLREQPLGAGIAGDGEGRRRKGRRGIEIEDVGKAILGVADVIFDALRHIEQPVLLHFKFARAVIVSGASIGEQNEGMAGARLCVKSPGAAQFRAVTVDHL